MRSGNGVAWEHPLPAQRSCACEPRRRNLLTRPGRVLAGGRALAVVVVVVDCKDRRAVTAAIPRGRGMFDGTPFERCSGTELCGTNRKGYASGHRRGMCTRFLG